SPSEGERGNRRHRVGDNDHRLTQRLPFISERGRVPKGTVVIGTRKAKAVSKLRSSLRTKPATSAQSGLGSICKLSSDMPREELICTWYSHTPPDPRTIASTALG